jgi:hypothetical protein
MHGGVHHLSSFAASVPGNAVSDPGLAIATPQKRGVLDFFSE